MPLPMLDFRPVGYVIGCMIAVLGLTMLAPLCADLLAGNGHWPAFLQASVISILAGGAVAMSCANAVGEGLDLRQTFLLTVMTWLVLPFFGAIPFVVGATEASGTDAFFEAMSGLTTTGATVFEGLDDLPAGLLLWRGLLQWLGGVGIIVSAMVFLPELRVGGMQIFRSEGFDTMGKILPRATEIARRISVIYIMLTITCALTYAALGMDQLDAITHAMTTIATGGFANYDSSFSSLGMGAEYAATIFMVLAALPFVRYVQLLGGNGRPLLSDPQVRAFGVILLLLVVVFTSVIWSQTGQPSEVGFRKALFNVTSILTGTGYASADYMAWGAFAIVGFFFIGLIGGCAGSTACSVKVFRYQLLFASIRAQIRQLHSPHGIFAPQYQGRPVGQDVLNSVMSFFVVFLLSIMILSIALSLTGLDLITSLSGAASAIANIGPGLGDEIGPSGNYAGLNSMAKWLLAGGMLLGRLEIMAVLVILTVRFWRD